MESVRKPFQGVGNIIRFNWHYYILSAIAISVLLMVKIQISELSAFAIAIVFLIVIANLVSLLVSFYIYDCSPLYKLNWIEHSGTENCHSIVNITAGFDETSCLLKQKFPDANLTVLDFYDPKKHTEISIKRARKVYATFPNTMRIGTSDLPLEKECADQIFVILSAHEIRDDGERTIFFHELNRVTKTHGNIIVTEHLRDLPNFLAYNIGFFHFHSKHTWKNSFRKAGLTIAKEVKITPFITAFILQKNGTTS